MKTLGVTPEQLVERTQWEAAGRSPANSPMAVIQSAQSLAQFLAIPDAGIDPYELVRAIVMNGPLANSDVQRSKEEILAQQQQLAGLGVPHDPGAPADMGAQPDGGMLGGLPPEAAAAALADVLNQGG